eukprot:CAMPEP_0197888106 /NCGR_PEP_ID=MMETSP1439-20131203/21116_1 /TAXON_ID=66791 /ORGANISM="Gonyaulax spinifera, Strain CCMP409" /LENGTH=42 /DNA_ID= /DNA_START= /DNA_END= /DNA_ORIENTATION=
MTPSLKTCSRMARLSFFEMRTILRKWGGEVRGGLSCCGSRLE